MKYQKNRINIACSSLMLLLTSFTNQAISQEEYQELEIGLEGKIQPRCSAFTLNNGNKFDLSVKNSATLDFTIDCNEKVTIEIKSKNGGFMALEAEKPENILTLPTIPYSLNLKVKPVFFIDIGNGNYLINNDYSSNDLKKQITENLTLDNNITSKRDGSLTVNMESTNREELFAGTYTDTITVTISSKDS